MRECSGASGSGVAGVDGIVMNVLVVEIYSKTYVHNYNMKPVICFVCILTIT